MVGTPGQQPRLHVFVLDVMAGLDLAVRLTDLGEHPLLVGHVGFDRIRDEKVGASPRNLGQFSQPPLDLRFQPDTQGRTPCVRHKHILAH